MTVIKQVTVFDQILRWWRKYKTTKCNSDFTKRNALYKNFLEIKITVLVYWFYANARLRMKEDGKSRTDK